MINISNLEYFSASQFNAENVPSSLLEIYTHPKNVQMDLYSKKPFFSLVSDHQDSVPNIDFRNTQCICIPKGRIISKFTDFNEYMGYVEKYPNNQFANILYLIDNSSDMKDIIMITAIPIYGIIRPIYRDTAYDLLAASLVMTDSFVLEGLTYNKLLYVAVRLKTILTVNEYVVNGINTHIQHNFYINKDYEIIYAPNKFNIPYMKQTEFHPDSKKKLFYLSDIPKEVMKSIC